MSSVKGIKKPKISINNPLFTLPVGDKTPEIVNMLVEIPKGCFNKYEYITNLGTIKLDRVIYEQIPYPVEYGCVPQTWDEDDDMLDIMSLISTPTFPGCMLRVRPIGVMIFIDGGKIDDKILGVASDDVRFDNIKDIHDLENHKLDEISFFFQNYKQLQFKYRKQRKQKVEFKGWKDRVFAYKVIESAIKRYKETYLNQDGTFNF